MNIGIDLGFTIKGVRREGNRDKIAPDSFRVIAELVKRGDTVFIISKVTSEQKVRAEKWLNDVDFYNQTGVKPENVYFCFERRDKCLFVKALNINVMIDDRAEVMAHISPLVVKFLISPEADEYEKHIRQLGNCKLVLDWSQIGQALL
jgi:hypothetical protein